MAAALRWTIAPLRRLGSGASRLASRLRPDAAARPPWERSVLDDIAMRRPWNIAVKVARARARLRLRVRGLEQGVTVVIVSWNTRDVLADVLRAVRQLSPADTRILVVDNASTDGTRAMLEGWPGIRTMRLPGNAGHGVALDLALCSVRTRVAVTLDSDAIPLQTGWLAPAVGPIRSGSAVLAGLRARRDFVHPVYLAIDTAAFLRRRLSFQVHVQPGVRGDAVQWGKNAWDTAELLTPRLARDEVVLIDRTDNPAPDLPGMTTGGVVYHHGGMSRASDGGLTEGSLEGWRSACRALGIELVETSRP
jgi:hypothetical protein